MSVEYKAVGWNRQKKIYDTVVVGGLLLYLAVFVAASLILRPDGTIETLLIRGLGTAALLLLHVILAIGPLCRLDRRFRPLLYNRRLAPPASGIFARSRRIFAVWSFRNKDGAGQMQRSLTSL